MSWGERKKHKTDTKAHAASRLLDVLGALGVAVSGAVRRTSLHSKKRMRTQKTPAETDTSNGEHRTLLEGYFDMPPSASIATKYNAAGQQPPHTRTQRQRHIEVKGAVLWTDKDTLRRSTRTSV